MLQKIESILHSSFPDSKITVIDESHFHQGHSGNKMSKESHFKIIIYNNKLKQMKLLNSHKAIYQALHDIIGNIHAISIEVK